MSTPDNNRFVYVKSPASTVEFIEFWAARYDDPNEHLYSTNIGNPRTPFTLGELFRWVIGKRSFTEILTRTLEPYFLSQIDKAAQLPQDISAETFLQAFPKGGALLRIFWLHCWHPDRFPIYDRHVHRAMVFIREGRQDDLNEYSEAEKVESYLQRYIPFFQSFCDADARSHLNNAQAHFNSGHVW